MRKRETCARALGAVAAALGMAAVLTGCVTAEGGSASQAPPKNYREQVAAKIRQMEDDPSAIQYVGITRPKEMFLGLLGTRIAVCAQVERPNVFGVRAAWFYKFYFENGEIFGGKMATAGPLLQPLQRCEPPLTTITDLVRPRR